MTLNERIADDYYFLLDSPEEFTVGTGNSARVSTTSIIRTVAALNTEATRAQFVEAMVAIGINAATAAKQFAESRKVTMSDSDGSLTLNADGSITEAA